MRTGKDGLEMDNEKRHVLRRSLTSVLEVEIFFKVLTFFIIGPLLDWIFTTWVLEDTPVFNEKMFLSILTPFNLILTLILFLLAGLWCCYEVSCLIHAVYWAGNGKQVGLEEILKGSAGALRGLKHPSILLAAVYFVLFLPLVHAGYLNSLVPRLEIPRFVIGELQRTEMGNLGIQLIHAVYVVLFLAFVLVPPAMILKRLNFIQAVKQNFLWYRLFSWRDKLKLWAVFLLWFFAELWLMQFLSGRLIQNQDFNISVLKYIVRSESYRRGLFYWLFLTVLLYAAMTCLYLFLFKLLEKYKELTVIPVPKKDTQVLKQTAQTAAGSGKLLVRAGRMFWNSRKHKKLWAGFAFLLIAVAVIGYFNEAPLVHKPWAIGHRGSLYAVENTTEAVEAAAKQGADYAEIDVQLSKDGIPVVFHDDTLSRLAGVSEKVEDLTVKELKQQRLTVHSEEGKIPTFEEMIHAALGAEKPVGLLVELKPTQENKEELVRKVIETVETCNAQRQCIFMSLDHESVRMLKAERPKWWVGYCIYGGAGKIEDAVWEYEIDFLAVEEGLASNSFLERARNSWLPVYIWTANNFDDMESYLQMGALGIITDMPDLARREIDEYGKQHKEYYVYEGDGYPAEK